jgi:phosphatidylinositol 4-kinase
MLALRRKMLSPGATASLTMKLVDLALVSPPEVFSDIVGLLSTLSREGLQSENKLLDTSVCISFNKSLYTSFNVML